MSDDAPDAPVPETTGRGAPPVDPLGQLVAFERLEVGPVQLDAKRLTAPYRLVFDNRQEQIELVCSYEEKVFAPGETESCNLADMIAAQVALNYGLFCRSIVFHGNYDETDRRFLRDMAENTAREIYIKKFLEPNPFLTGAAGQLPPLKQKKYLRAAIVFKRPAVERPAEKWSLWSTDKRRHAVLSSGGKDSLLSFGLLAEIGREVHPIFVNESGRHWLTALNAYRHFQEQVPNTGRVWINSDRVFSWMLQRMPFIRKNFSAVRSDEYPIRLWTVAVFLFSILPLVRKRGIGRIVIGDEYDTTVRASHHGMRHYDGLYDQSVYFDNALSRYFMRKGWSVSQFSVLRPLSELLIEKILAERYPRLQQHQISCHAAHKEGERILPCGRCEKCRRIIGMLTALGIDPGRCGYASDRIEACLKDFSTTRLSQEAPAREHLGYMLAAAGRIRTASGEPPFRQHPEILKLRFHPQQSPLTAVPADLRRDLYPLFLQHCQGATVRVGHRWVDVDPTTLPDMDAPYPFELDRPRTGGSGGGKAGAEDRCLWGELTWREARQHIQAVNIALLPVGAIEQHGPHLPLDTDAFDADLLARRVARACSRPRPLVLPLLPYGVSYHHEGFQGTISIENDTLSRLVYDVGVSAARNGIRKLVIINGHGGNSPALNYAAQMINRDAHIFVCVDTGETSDVDVDRVVETPNDVHAGEIETSTSLAVRPHLVRMERAEPAVPKFSSRYLDFTGKRSTPWYAHTRKISASGVMGDPTRASAAKGEQIWEIMVAHLVALVEDLKGMTLDEIYNRRY
jgi:creatinine amidohydrolase/Fe(II)-dependent formamide hydrolase-like protein/7-cyano-7-deazaguanine synthase in queuosine biosynthesis